jgi:uncharacterized protein (DUF1697 family)
VRSEVAFLRAVNVAGHALVKMSDLKRLFESAGCKNVKTFIQSGNILFESMENESGALHLKLQRKLAELLGLEVTVAYRTARELQVLVAADPFRAMKTDPSVKLYVGFLATNPKTLPALPIVSAKEGLEIHRMTKGEVFVVSRSVKGRYGFPNNLIEKAFGVPATTRNWNTVVKIATQAAERTNG